MKPSDHFHGPRGGERRPLDAHIRLARELRLLVVDGRDLVASGLRTVLEEVLDEHLDVRVCGHEDGWQEIADELERHEPDVVALEVSERALIRALRARDPALVIVVLTPDDHQDQAVDLLRDGADGVVSMSASASAVAMALLTAATGATPLPPGAARSVVPRIRPVTPVGLSDDDIEVWRLIATGATDRRIASTLHVSERTAKRRVSDLLRTLDATNRVEAAYLAGWWAVVEPDDRP